jgi:N-acetylgalactosamine-6-sulfatase
MNFRWILILAVLIGWSSSHPARAADRPNILFIYADDWGWGDLACHGHPHMKTPNLDRLAREGTDFHQFTVCNPVCSPSRTAIVTGHFPARHRVHQHFARHEDNVARGMPDWLDPSVPLLPRILKEAGYTTGHFGKWHLSGGGIADAPLPTAYGYDDAAVWTGPGKNVFDGTSVADKVGTAHDKIGACYLSAAAVEHAIRFIRSAKRRPFFVNLWLHETHHLVAATDEDKQAYPDTAEPQRTYYAAVTRADRLVGLVLETLQETGADQNTIVIFSSDNGPEDTHPNPGDKFYYSVGSTGGLRGRKRSLYMGGVNTPFIVRWPGQVPAGRIDTTTVLSGVDVLPTLLAAADIPLPADYQPDGVNALPALRGETLERTKPLFWEWLGTHAKDANWPELGMRDGNWGLLMTADGKRVELYDLLQDRRQRNNLATQEPRQVASMIAALKAWKTTLPPSSKSLAVVTRRKPANRPTPDRARAFTRWDTNKDETLTLEEYREGLSKPANAETRFKNFDKNGDGKLTRDEFVTPDH